MNDANSVWDFMLLILWFFLLVAWVMIVFNILTDLFRDKTTGGFTKFLWCLFLIVLPVVATLIYIVVRGRSMAERTIEHQAQAKADLDAYIRQTAGAGGGGGDPVAQIASAKSLLDSGAIDQAEFEKLKAKALV